jgi:hypothetical protein
MTLSGTRDLPLQGSFSPTSGSAVDSKSSPASQTVRAGVPCKAKIWLGGPLTFRDESGRFHDLDARGVWEFLIALSDLRHQVIESAAADETNQTQICFELCEVVAARTHPQDETWGLLGPDGMNLAGMPEESGGLADRSVLRNSG